MVDGQVVKTKEYSNDDTDKKEFDKNGNLVKLEERNGDISKYKYDSKNNLIEEIKLVDGKENEKSVYEYDNKNLLIKKETFLHYAKLSEPLKYYFEYEFYN
jgi:YD repeat-containing protein